MTSPGKDEKGARGFEGLDDLLSDEPEAPNQQNPDGQETRANQADSPPPLPEEPPSPPRSARGVAAADTSGRTELPPQTEPLSWTAASIVVLVAIIGVGIMIETPSSPVAPDSVQSEDGYMSQHSASSFLKDLERKPAESQSGDQSLRSELAAEWNESLPPMGEDRVLSRDQLRYCLAERARMDAMEKAVNEYNQADVDTFNGYVNDFNSRCGSFRYQASVLESVQREVDAVQLRLAQEGRVRLREH